MKRIAHIDAAKKIILGVYIYEDDHVLRPGQMTEADALAAGYSHQPPPPARCPDSMAPWKLRAALGKRGLVEQINAFIASQPEPPRIQLLAAWEYATEIPRRSAFVAAVTKGLKLTEGTVDEIFIEAANIQDA